MEKLKKSEATEFGDSVEYYCMEDVWSMNGTLECLGSVTILPSVLIIGARGDLKK